MNFDQVRQDIETYFRPLWEAQYPTFEWITSNSKKVDLSTQPGPFMTSEIRYYGHSYQANINGSNPLTRFNAWLSFNIYVKEFTGEKQANECLDFISSSLAYNAIGSVRLKHPVPMPSDDFRGWHVVSFRIPIEFESLK